MLKKRFSITALVVCLGIAGATAQNEDNALKYSLTKPTGTARSMALGGAMGALGGDYSAIGINPAGIAVYRSSEFSFTPSLLFNNTESNYYGSISEDNKFSLPINQISYVGTMQPMRVAENGLVSTHFALGYNRTNNFNQKSFIQASGVQSSMLDMFIANSDGLTPQGLDNFYTGIAYDAHLTDLLPNIGDAYFHGYEYLDTNNDVLWGPSSGVDQMKVVTEEGYSGLFDASYGANFSNKFYIGASMGIASIYNNVKSQYYEKSYEYYNDYINYREANEDVAVLDDYYFDDNEQTTGIGLNLKLGMIYRPIDNLRLGAAVHTPTYYSMKMEYDTRAQANFFDADNYDIESPLGDISFNFRTPLKAVGSIAYLFGDRGLISFDYEFTDYSNMKYNSKNTDMVETSGFNALNNTINSTFKSTHNLRFGAEFRVSPMVSLRGGYAHFDNPYQDSYLNSSGKHYNVTGGLGFRQQNMFVDLAYLYRYQSYIHSLYYSPYIDNEFQEPADMTSIDHQIAVTIGWKF
jgi:hypothetical protein